jgi:hypothetical protein
VSTDDQMSIEDRVRTATRAGASLVHDVRPLGAPKPVRLRHRPARPPRRWLSWGIPLAAAAAVVAIALTLVAIRQPTASVPTRPPVPTGSNTTVPRYYATLDVDASGDLYTGPLIVGDDLTGKVIATVAPPSGLVFDTVQGAADDRTFVIMAGSKAANGSAPFTWFMLRIFPGTAHPYQLTKLAIKSPQGLAYALSPNGQELAVESLGSASSTTTPTTLALYSVLSGAELRAWTTPTDILKGAGVTLSWLPGGQQLVFSVGQFTTGTDYSLQLRRLDVTGSATDLLAASRGLLTIPNSGPSTCNSLHITPDGETAICATQYDFESDGGSNAGCAGGGLQFTAYSIRTGKPVRVLYQNRGACHNGAFITLWTGASASEIIGETGINLANEGGKQAFQLGVITGGHFRPLKISSSVYPWDYGRAAF